jgi:RES domain-containing protein
MAFKAQPLTSIGHRVDCGRIVDLTAPAVLVGIEIDHATLAGPWEDLASRGSTPPSWRLAETRIGAGHHGVLVPSFAPGTGPTDRNLVLWRWGDTPPCRVRAIDDFDS